ncbi:MAG: hypothetical protein JWL70_1724 [Acidimicrobiia bacterium]|nr:hypothetical protein [Acidimicrobiia bacterium]
MQSLPRRSFLLGGAAVTALAACGGKSSASSAGGAAKGSDLVMFQDPNSIVTDIDQRFAFGMRNSDGSLIAGGPASLLLDLQDIDGKAVASGLTAVRHESASRSYWVTTHKFDRPGNYQMVSKSSGHFAFTVAAKDQVPIPNTGDHMIPFDTPTADNTRGVDPICTRDPACPFHSQTLTQALASGKPVAFLVATPAYCQTAVCGPVLNVLIDASKNFSGKIQIVHSEVYSAKFPPSGEAPPYAPALTAYHLGFEPCLFLAGADGVIRQRLDVIYDNAEVTAALNSLLT